MKALVSLTIAVCLASVSYAGNLRSEIVAMNAKVAKLMKAKDMDGFSKLLKPKVTADFKHVESGRSMGFDQMVAEMKQGFKMMEKITEVSTKIISLKESGNTATCKGQHVMKATMKGTDKVPHTMSFIGVSTDVYKKVNGVWKLASMTWGEQKMLMDGKPMDMSGAGGGQKK